MVEGDDPAGNVIRPAFGAPHAAQAAAPARTPAPEAQPTPEPEEWRPMHSYGEAADYVVGLLRDEEEPEGRTHRVVIGRADANSIETVAIVSATTEGEIDAERIAFAVLRTLEIVGRFRMRQHPEP